VNKLVEKATVRNMVEIYYDSQQFRMRTVSRLKKSSNDESFKEICEETIAVYLKQETRIAARLKTEMQSHIMSQWLYANYGIGPILAAGLVAYVDEIERFGTVSKLWKYAGMSTIDVCQDCGKRIIEDGARGAWILHLADRLFEQSQKNKDKKKKMTHSECIEKATSRVCLCPNPTKKTMADRRVIGQMLEYNPKFKNLCFLIGDQFIRQMRSPYRKKFDEYKLDYSTRPDLKAEIEERKRAPKDENDKFAVKGTARVHSMARRKAVKLFLSHFWQTWREVLGLPAPEPYAIAHLGHVDKIPPFVSLEDAGYVFLDGKWMHDKILCSIPDHIDVKTVRDIRKQREKASAIILPTDSDVGAEDFTGSIGEF
jgi:Transposase IS116/IS110/IS902 family